MLVAVWAFAFFTLNIKLLDEPYNDKNWSPWAICWWRSPDPSLRLLGIVPVGETCGQTCQRQLIQGCAWQAMLKPCKNKLSTVTLQKCGLEAMVLVLRQNIVVLVLVSHLWSWQSASLLYSGKQRRTGQHHWCQNFGTASAVSQILSCSSNF